MGVAIGLLVIPIIRGLTPYGLVAKYQGLQASGKTVSQVAQEVFKILVASPKTRSRMLTCLVDTALQANQGEEAVEKLAVLETVENLPPTYLERLREGAAGAAVFTKGGVLAKLNELLVKRGIEKVAKQENKM